MEAITAIIKNFCKNTVGSHWCGCGGRLVLGLIFGWVVWPVQWTDGTPEVLRADLQEDYLRMTIDSYQPDWRCEYRPWQRWDNLGEAAGCTFSALQSDPGYLIPATSRNLANWSRV